MPERKHPDEYYAIVKPPEASLEDREPTLDEREYSFHGDTSVKKLFEGIAEVAQILFEAAQFLQEYSEKEPKIKKLFEVPQSADKHAEGSTIKDHYQHIIAAMKILSTDVMKAEHIRTRIDIEGLEEEWDDIIQYIQKNQAFMYAFSLNHDLGKYDFFLPYARKKEGEKAGFLSKKKFFEIQKTASLADREQWMDKYRALFQKYKENNSQLDEQKAYLSFFEEYGVTVTYIGHESGLDIPENAETAERVSTGLGLTAEQKGFLKFCIEQHVSGYLSFEKGTASYHALAQVINEAGYDRREAMRAIQAGVMVDGIFGSRKVQPDIPGYSVAVDRLGVFLRAEQDYPRFLEEEKRKVEAEQRLRLILEIEKKHKLRGGDIITLGFLPPKNKLSAFIERVHQTVSGNEELVVSENEMASDNAEILRQRITSAQAEYVAIQSGL